MGADGEFLGLVVGMIKSRHFEELYGTLVHSADESIALVGRDGVTLAEKWADGAASLFGMMSRGFPNLFVMPAPGQQAVVTVNYTQLAVLGGEFIIG